MWLSRLGITPACAGKTPSRAVLDCLLKDHPRVCGENRHGRKALCAPRGSPPRVRGKHWDKAWNGLKERITPACAGKTVGGWSARRWQQDHPRVCGENHPRTKLVNNFLGSPPRVRGKPSTGERIQTAERITPACAGKTAATCVPFDGAQDHPRVCGENNVCI